MKALIDTGASISLITERDLKPIAAQHSVEIEQSSEAPVSITGHQLDITGKKVTLHLNIGNLKVEVSCHKRLPSPNDPQDRHSKRHK